MEPVSSEPSGSQHLTNRSKTRSWDRAVVYNQESGSVKIRKKKNVAKDLDQTKADYTVLKWPKGKTAVSLFVDPETKTELKTEYEAQNIKDVFLARLSLDHLGLKNRTLLFLGCLSTLYVSAPWNDGSSHASSAAQ